MTDQFSLTKLNRSSDLRFSELVKHTIANSGYLGFEPLVQYSHKNALLLENYTGINEQILRYQGSDFFAAPATAYLIGNIVLSPLIKLTQKYSDNALSNFCEKNYRLIRSTVTLAALTAYEYLQGQEKGRSFDTADIAAYALGITALCHAEDIGKFFWKNVNSVFRNEKQQNIPAVNNNYLKT